VSNKFAGGVLWRLGAIMLELYPYQTAAVQALRLALAGGAQRVMLYSPTGSGKTEMALAIIHGALAKGKRAAFLCNRIHLVEQASRRFYASGIDHGIIQGDNTRDTHSPVLIGSIDTVARRGFPDVDVIVIDEAHAVAGSERFRGVVFKNNNRPIIGLSATPFARGLGKIYRELINEPLFEQMVVAASIAELIDADFLVDAEFYAPAEPDLSGVKMTRNGFGESDYNEIDLGKAVDTPELIGDIVSHWRKLADGTPTVVFATNIAHSKHITEQFRAAGVAAEHLDCYTEDAERKAILARIASGETTVISNIGILAEGWDFPACRTLILARPTKSLIRYVQMVGRVLRKSPGKDKALVLDHSGTVKRLGFPTDDLPLQLDDGKPRVAAKQRERKDPLPKLCPACKFMKPPKVHACPKCGFEPERQSDVEVGDGELVKVKRGKKAIRPETKQHVYSQLLFIAQKRTYSLGWVSHKYRAMFDVWPKNMRDVPATPTQELLNWLRSHAIRYAKGNEKPEAHHAAP
jgi:DNA repair protein RadD